MTTRGVPSVEAMSTATAATPHPVHRFVRPLLRGIELPPDVQLGAALRLPTTVVPVGVVGADADTVTLEIDLSDVPATRCVLTIMVGDVVRIDLPVRLRRDEAGAIVAHPDGVPLVLRRRVTVSALLAAGLAAA